MNGKDIFFQKKEELRDAWENARSIGAYNIPQNLVYIGSLKEESGIYHFYKEVGGDYFYESERILQFNQEMKKLQREKKEEYHVTD